MKSPIGFIIKSQYVPTTIITMKKKCGSGEKQPAITFPIYQLISEPNR